MFNVGDLVIYDKLWQGWSEQENAKQIGLGQNWTFESPGPVGMILSFKEVKYPATGDTHIVYEVYWSNMKISKHSIYELEKL